MKRLAFLLLALVCFLVAAIAVATPEFPEDEPLDAGKLLDEARARAILAKVMPTPTPWEFGFLEVTSAGNVAIATRPVGAFVAGQAPVNALPERCREDFKKLPRGASLVCFADDTLARRATGQR